MNQTDDEGGGGGRELATTSTGAGSGGSTGEAGSGDVAGTGAGGAACQPELAACSEDGDCCSGDCLAGQVCGPPLCKEAGEPCDEAVDCCSQACEAGLCAVEDGSCKPGVGPVALAVHLGAPGHVATDGEAVYFSDTTAGTVSRRSIFSGPAEVLAEDASMTTAIVPTDLHVFWTQYDSGGGGLHRTSKLTGETELWMSGAAWGIAIGNEFVYAVVDSQIFRFPLGGGAPESLASGVSTLGLSIDETHLFWADYDKGELWRMPLPGGAPELLAAGLPEPVNAVTNGTRVAWVDWDTLNLHRMALPGGPVDKPLLLPGRPRGPVWAPFEDTLYFAHIGLDGTGALWKLPSGGDVPEVVATSVTPQTVDLAIGGNCVYFTDASTHAVKRVAR